MPRGQQLTWLHLLLRSCAWLMSLTALNLAIVIATKKLLNQPSSGLPIGSTAVCWSLAVNTIDIGAVACKARLWKHLTGWALVILDIISMGLLVLGFVGFAWDGWNSEEGSPPRPALLDTATWIYIVIGAFHALSCILGFVDCCCAPERVWRKPKGRDTTL